jgi:hypothetical protein
LGICVLTMREPLHLRLNTNTLSGGRRWLDKPYHYGQADWLRRGTCNLREIRAISLGRAWVISLHWILDQTRRAQCSMLTLWKLLWTR